MYTHKTNGAILIWFRQFKFYQRVLISNKLLLITIVI